MLMGALLENFLNLEQPQNVRDRLDCVVFSFLFSDFLICFFFLFSSSSSSSSSLFLVPSSFFFNRFNMFGRSLHARRGFYQVYVIDWIVLYFLFCFLIF